ncbi:MULTISPECIES: NADPH-dependent FMN reductase [unclassified Lactococcus]|uniref:NADPH-dependent FMN reductase n=1 Tax=unclassified Lactococcus TaxID=2643510 RepID=UPI0011C7D65C|nr:MULTISPECIES: NADPH-dependent FMN reductase [unclassified Lactococcus]MQW22919.1 NAD(P)H-dependent oxidoreductase [Lactococcus sp. dk101]TXK44534.1 NAD(P)H-dependent oxidoreductase [Lactococcus sp. dk310]TXK50387.1 NAD(P)H-dependent oxidoreductase [Lactococcus sp. dk322]
MKIAAIVGSLSNHSTSRKVLLEGEKYFSDAVELSEINYSDLPLFNVDNEFPRPASIDRIMDEINASDGLVIVVPEYNLSVPGVLKNLLDWVSRATVQGAPKPTLNKPVLIITTSAGVSGGMVPQEQTRSILNYLGAHVMSQPRISFANIYKNFDENGNFAFDETSAKFYETTVQAFETFVKKFHQ